MLCNLLFSDFKDDVCFSNYDTSPVGVVFSCLLTPASIMFLKILKITIPKQRGTLVNSPSIPEFITDCQKKKNHLFVVFKGLCDKKPPVSETSDPRSVTKKRKKWVGPWSVWWREKASTPPKFFTASANS